MEITGREIELEIRVRALEECLRAFIQNRSEMDLSRLEYHKMREYEIAKKLYPNTSFNYPK